MPSRRGPRREAPCSRRAPEASPCPGPDAVPPNTPRRRATALLLCAALLALAAAAAWALSAPGLDYAWPRTMVSDLGARRCFQAPDRWICSPRGGAFDVGFVLSGLLLATAALCLPSGTTRVPFLRLAFAATGAGLVVLGLFPADVDHRPHMVGAVLALPVTAALLLVSAVRKEEPRARRRPASLTVLRGAGAALALAATLPHLVPAWAVQGAAEMVSLSSLLLVLLLEAAALALPGGVTDARS